MIAFYIFLATVFGLWYLFYTFFSFIANLNKYAGFKLAAAALNRMVYLY